MPVPEKDTEPPGKDVHLFAHCQNKEGEGNPENVLSTAELVYGPTHRGGLRSSECCTVGYSKRATKPET